MLIPDTGWITDEDTSVCPACNVVVGAMRKKKHLEWHAELENHIKSVVRLAT